jgi:cobalt/nickel transport system permease protein
LSHIHLPDGVIPLGWWLAGWAMAFVWLLLATRSIRGTQVRRRLPLLGAMGALMLLTMSIPLGPLPLHLNLTVLTGISAGPWLGYIVVFAVNLMLSWVGHGGLTTGGLNTLVMGIELALGWWFYQRLLARQPLRRKALVATALALLVSVLCSLSLIGWSTGLGRAVLALDPWHLSAVPHGSEDEVLESASWEGHEAAGTLQQSARFWGRSGYAALAALLLSGIAIESLTTWAVIQYLDRVRPDLLSGC